MLAVCGAVAGCGNYDHIVAWGEAQLDALRRRVPCENEVSADRRLTVLMNRINEARSRLFSRSWFVAPLSTGGTFGFVGSPSCRGHNRTAGEEPIFGLDLRYHCSPGAEAGGRAQQVVGPLARNAPMSLMSCPPSPSHRHPARPDASEDRQRSRLKVQIIARRSGRRQGARATPRPPDDFSMLRIGVPNIGVTEIGIEQWPNLGWTLPCTGSTVRTSSYRAELELVG